MESQRPKRKAAEAAIASLAQSQQSPKKRTPTSSRKGRKNKKQEKMPETTTVTAVDEKTTPKETPQDALPSEIIKDSEKLEGTLDLQKGAEEPPKAQETLHHSDSEKPPEQKPTNVSEANEEKETIQGSNQENNSLQPSPPPAPSGNEQLTTEPETSNNITVNNIVEDTSEWSQPSREPVNVGSNLA